jgi:archaemetzincin
LRVGLVGFEGLDAGLLGRVSAALAECYPRFDLEIVSEAIPFPAVRSRPRSGGPQFHAGEVVNHLHRAFRGEEFDLILALAAEDLYVPELNFVFGLASIRDGIAVVSVHRLSETFYGRPSDDRAFLRRTIIEAAHELGHLLGLGHCVDPRCVMFFSNSILDTDTKTHLTCPRCRRKMGIRWPAGALHRISAFATRHWLHHP